MKKNRDGEFDFSLVLVCFALLVLCTLLPLAQIKFIMEQNICLPFEIWIIYARRIRKNKNKKMQRQNAIEMNILKALENTLLALNWLNLNLTCWIGPLLLGINSIDVHSPFKWRLLSADVQQCTLASECMEVYELLVKTWKRKSILKMSVSHKY